MKFTLVLEPPGPGAGYVFTRNSCTIKTGAAIGHKQMVDRAFVTFPAGTVMARPTCKVLYTNLISKK